MPDNNLDQAVALSRSGRKLEARKILNDILRSNLHNETAWLWFADTFTENNNRIRVMEECIRHNPNCYIAQKWLITFKAQEEALLKRDQVERSARGARRVAFQGIEGSYSQLAARKYFAARARSASA